MRPIDGALVAAVLALGAGCVVARADSWVLLGTGVVVLALGGLLLLVSAGTARWLSKAHLELHSTAASARTTSLVHRRSVGRRLPSPYPDAWYVVALTAELEVGAVIDVTVCGHALVVFRPRDGGVPSALDAYCPHLGAHLAHGGAQLTADSCIRCPFHGWCFNGDGKLQRTETGDAAPAGSSLRAWPVRERNGVVSVWMASAGHGGRGAAAATTADNDDDGTRGGGGDVATAPWFEIPTFPELMEGAYAYHGMSEHVVPALIWELPENGADIGHLSALHSRFVVAALRPLLSHAWAASWRADPHEPHLARLTIVESMVLLGVTLPGAVRVAITQCGPSQVYLQFNLPGIGRLLLIETVTPIAPAQQRVLHAVYAAPHVPRLVAKALLASVVRAYEQDLPVWAHKRYEPAPRLTASEGAVAAYRKWARQFVASPRAITFQDAQKAQLRLDLGLPEDETLSW